MAMLGRLSLLTLLLALQGCISGPTTWVYPADPAALRRVPDVRSPLTVAVPPFADERSRVNEHPSYLSVIPLVLWETTCRERPERLARSWEFDPTSDLASAAAHSLGESGLFADVRRVAPDQLGDADLVLRGTLRSTRQSWSILTYGISFAATPLWLLGLPAGWGDWRVEVALSLVDPQGAELWQGSYAASDDRIMGLYYLGEPDVAVFARLVQQVLNEAVAELAEDPPRVSARAGA